MKNDKEIKELVSEPDALKLPLLYAHVRFLWVGNSEEDHDKVLSTLNAITRTIYGGAQSQKAKLDEDQENMTTQLIGCECGTFTLGADNDYWCRIEYIDSDTDNPCWKLIFKPRTEDGLGYSRRAILAATLSIFDEYRTKLKLISRRDWVATLAARKSQRVLTDAQTS